MCCGEENRHHHKSFFNVKRVTEDNWPTPSTQIIASSTPQNGSSHSTPRFLTGAASWTHKAARLLHHRTLLSTQFNAHTLLTNASLHATQSLLDGKFPSPDTASYPDQLTFSPRFLVQITYTLTAATPPRPNTSNTSFYLTR